MTMMAMLIVLAMLVLAVLAVARLRKSGRPWWSVLGLFAAIVSLSIVVLVVIVLGLRMFVGHSVPVEEARHRRTVQVGVSRSASSSDIVGTAWVPSGEHEFAADVYPSVESAAVATIGLMLDQLDRLHAPGERLKLNLAASDGFPWSISTLALAIERHLPAVEVRTVASTTLPESAQGCSVLFSQPADRFTDPDDIQTLEATLTTSTGDTTKRQARFTLKGWVEDLAAFEARQPGVGHRYMVAYSPGSCATPDEAETEALQSAAAMLGARIDTMLGRQRWNVHDPERAREEILLALRGTHPTMANMQDTGPVLDTFVQRFDRPYGQFWRAAVLVDAGPKSTAALVQHFREVRTLTMASWQRTALSIAGLVVLILVVYLFLNAATKGYYVWAMRVAAGVLVIGGILFVLAFVS